MFKKLGLGALCMSALLFAGCQNTDSDPAASGTAGSGDPAVPALKPGEMPHPSMSMTLEQYEKMKKAGGKAPKGLMVKLTDGKEVPVEELEAKDEKKAPELSKDEIEAINKLPEGERAAALAQAVCPVSGDNLGAMDVPVKVEFEGKSIYLCCKGCKKDFDKEPAKFIAKAAGKK